MLRTSLTLVALLGAPVASAEPPPPREPIDYIRCSSHMENAARAAHLLRSGHQASYEDIESAAASRTCAELANTVLTSEHQREAFRKAHRIFLMAVEAPSVNTFAELHIALTLFNETLR